MRTQASLIGLGLALMAMSAAAQTTVTSSGTTATTGNVPYVSAATSTSTTVRPSPISVSGGNVGIGTTSPQSILSVAKPQIYGDIAIYGYSSSDIFGFEVNNAPNGGNDYRLEQGRYGNGTLSINDCSNGCAGRLNLLSNGNVGIGTTNPQAKLEVSGSLKLTAGSGGSITFQDGTTQSTAYTGVTCTGADYAEAIDVTGDRTKYEPGDVLMIDPSAPGKFLKASQAYSTLVAGIYSTKPGFVGRKQPSTPETSVTEVPMAMVGRVPTKVSAENGPIKVGDLLVASSTSGRAMKGTDRSLLTGAVIGKALGSLDSGTGIIEVLVTLQ